MIAPAADDRKMRIAAWALWITALAAAPLTAALFSSGNAAYEGTTIFLGAVGAISCAFVKTAASRVRMSVVLGVILWLCLIFQIIHRQVAREQLHASAHKLESALSSVENANAVTASTAKVETSPQPKPVGVTKDITSPMLDLVADSINDGAAIRDRLNTQFSAAHVETLLTPATLTDAAKMREAEQRLNALGAALDAYEHEISQLQNSFESKIQGRLSEKQRADFESSFQNTRWKTDALIAKYVGVEHALFSAIRSMYAFMRPRVGMVQLGQNGRLVFPTAADDGAYKSYLERAKSLAAEETRVQTEMDGMGAEARDKLREYAKEAAKD